MTDLVRIFTHGSAVHHDPGPHHPEAPERILAINRALRSCETVELQFCEPEPASDEQILLTHTEEHLERVRHAGNTGGGVFDPDTIMGSASLEAVFRAAGSAIAAADSALAGVPGFSAMRPPGHHASAGRAMGFCFLNNVVIAARCMLDAAGLERVLIVDWDVHHGNGTQDLVERDARIRYVSIHQYPHYPGTGAADEKGVGNIFNLPRPPGLPPSSYVADLRKGVETACDGWQPELLLISAGFDGLLDDPLGGFTLEPEHYASLTSEWVATGVPVASVLEGGYVPERTADAALAHVSALVGRNSLG